MSERSGVLLQSIGHPLHVHVIGFVLIFVFLYATVDFLPGDLQSAALPRQVACLSACPPVCDSDVLWSYTGLPKLTVADPGFAKGGADHGERAEREPKRGSGGGAPSGVQGLSRTLRLSRTSDLIS